MSRSKIAITIRDDLLAQLDRLIDGETIRNRSHAIEYFLSEALLSKAQKALVISGHKDFSSATLFEGKAVVEHQRELLRAGGVKKVVFFGYQGERDVERILGDGASYGMKIHYLWQDEEQIGTAYGVSLAKRFLRDGLFFTLYSHVIGEIDLKDFAVYHRESAATATIALTSIEDPTLYGAVQMKGEKIVRFIEKPKEKEGASRVISSGIFCFSPEIFDSIPKRKTASLERDVFPKLAKEGKLAGYMFEGKWCNVRNLICLPAKKKK